MSSSAVYMMNGFRRVGNRPMRSAIQSGSFGELLMSLRGFSETLAVTVSVGLTATAALADRSARDGREPSNARKTAYTHAMAVQHRHIARHTGDRFGRYPPPPNYATAPLVYYGPGYLFLPGHGILDEACNLPTSTCPNEYRDTR